LIENKTYRSFCPEALIEEATEDKTLRSIALFCVMRNRFSAWFYNKSSAAEKLGMSKGSFNALLEPLLRKGLVYYDGKRYRLLTRGEIQVKYNAFHCSTILIEKNDTLTNITYKLRLKVIEKFARQQERHMKTFKLIDSCKKGALKAVKAMQGGHPSLSYDEKKQLRIEKVKYAELLTDVGFTMEWLAAKLHCSTETIRRTIQAGIKKGFCKTKVLCKELKRMTYKEYKLHEPRLRKLHPSLCFKYGSVCYNVCTLFRYSSYWEQANECSSRKRTKRVSVDLQKV